MTTVEVTPFTGIRDAIRCRDQLCEQFQKLLVEYERVVPHTKVEAVVISRGEVKSRIGTRSSRLTVSLKVSLTE